MGGTRYFIYVRKSNRSDDRQKLSIPAQLKLVKRLAADLHLIVADIIVERESAHVAGRPLFNDMMRRIAAGEASGIIAWHPDRLARNSRDGGEIVYFIDTGKLTDLKFCSFWFENTPQGKANLGHEFVQSKQYSDKLSHDTKRGQEEKAEMGYYPNKAPWGYLNDVAAKTIVLDPQLAPVIKRAFEWYARGTVTIARMRDLLASEGLTTGPNKRWKSVGGNRIHCDYIRRFLRNPFYYGHFEYAGVLYEGKHTPIITKRLFDEVQQVLARRGHRMSPARRPKAFTRLLRCGECRMAITAESQKGHVYYRCSRKSRQINCSQPYVREEQLERDISQLLQECAMPAGWAEDMLARLAAESQDLTQNAETTIREKKAALVDLATKKQKLLNAYLEELIDRETFTEQKNELVKEKKTLQEHIIMCERDHHPWLEPFRRWILTAQTLGAIAQTGSLHEKKALAQEVFGSNLVLHGKQAHGKAVSPWSLLQNRAPDHTPAHWYYLARQHFIGGSLADGWAQTGALAGNRTSALQPLVAAF